MPRFLGAGSAALLVILVVPQASAEQSFGRGGFAARHVSPGPSFAHGFAAPASRGRLHKGGGPAFIVPVIPGFGFGGVVTGAVTEPERALPAEELGAHGVRAIAGIRPAPVGTPTIYVVEPQGRTSSLRRPGPKIVEVEPSEPTDSDHGPRVITAWDRPPNTGPLIITVPVR